MFGQELLPRYVRPAANLARPCRRAFQAFSRFLGRRSCPCCASVAETVRVTKRAASVPRQVSCGKRERRLLLHLFPGRLSQYDPLMHVIHSSGSRLRSSAGSFTRLYRNMPYCRCTPATDIKSKVSPLSSIVKVLCDSLRNTPPKLFARIR